MKRVSYMKQLAVGLMLGLMICSGFAANVVYSPAGAATNTVFTGTTQTNRAGAISTLVINNPSATATLTVRLIDAPSTVLTYTNNVGDWTNHTRTIISRTNVYTDILGNSVTNIYDTVTNTVAAAAAATNNFRSVGVWQVNSNSSLTVTFDPLSQFGLGLLATNNVACTLTFSYFEF